MRRRVILRTLALVIACYIGPLQSAEFPIDQRVLVVYGNTDIGPWEQEFNSTILRQLTTENAIPVVPEFLNLVGADPAELPTIADSLRVKYQSIAIDLIIALQPEANTFVHSYSDYFAPDAEVIYVLPGTDLLELEGFAENEFVVASAVGQASLKTVEAISGIFPNLDRLYVVGGSAAGDVSFMEQISEAIDESDIRDKIEYLIGLSMSELTQRLAGAPGETAILMATYDRDSFGQPLRTMAVSQMLAEELGLPVFSPFDSLLLSGAIGGSLTTAVGYADSAVQLALAVLATDDDYAFFVRGTSQYMFDATRLKEFGITPNQLPEGSILVNEQVGFWSLYWRWAVLGITFIAAQLLLIFYLISSIQRRKRLESKMLELRKNQALGDLAGGIAHDFNNILMVLYANTDLALRFMKNGEKLEGYLGNIRTATRRARDLVKQILAFSSGLENASRECKNPLELLNETVEQLRTFLPATCDIDLDCPDCLDTVEIDESQMSQVILNICINAQHAMKDEGKISISVNNVTVWGKKKLYSQILPPGKYVAIAISDTGPGIDAKNLSHIFKPFYSTKLPGRGTGLGLSMVDRVIKTHEAYIDVQTIKNRGSTFTIYLPSVESNLVSMEEPQEKPDTNADSMRVLLVDDDEMVLEGTANMLLELHCEVTKFSNPLMALAEFKNNPDKFEMLLTDSKLPEMDGIRLIESIREIRKDFPAVLYTGYMETVGYDVLGAITVLSKPANIDELFQALSMGRNEANIAARQSE